MNDESSADSTADVSDEDLVAAFLDGRREAFAHLYRRYYGRTYRLAYGMTANREAAEDLTQEVFMRIYGRLSQFEGSARFSTWFYRVAINLCLRHRERLRRRTEVAVDVDALADRGAVEHVDDTILAAQVGDQVHRALLSLRSVPRMIVILKDIEGLSYAEIADRLNCSEGTVASRLNRARTLLGRKLAHLKGAI